MMTGDGKVMKRVWSVSLFLFLLAVAVAASDYPISTPASSIHPAQESLVLTTLAERESSGTRTLKVRDASAVDPRQWLLLVSPDGELQETHCIKSVSRQDNEVKLSADLRRNFLGDSTLIQGSVARERGVVSKLSQPAGRGQSRLTLESAREIDALEQVILQSVDGRVREAHCVKQIVGTMVELEDDLENDYPEQSAVIQGRLIDGRSEGDDNPCCCDGKRAGRR